MISARAPGVEVEETNGLAGSGEAIRIRGQSSLVLQSDPIVIVDGVRQNSASGGVYTTVGLRGGAIPSPTRLNDLDFRDIQSIDVLKGPAASTEYGTDAANGVIVVTTKHGAAGRPQWTASAEAAASEVPEPFPNLYYSWGHTTGATRTPVNCPLVPYAYNSGYGSSVGTCALDSVTAWNPLNHSRYSIFGTGGRQKYDLSVSGGTDAVRYYVSGGLSNEMGVLHLPAVFVSEAMALGLPSAVFDPNGENQRTVRVNTLIALGPTTDFTVTGAYLSTYQRAPDTRVMYGGITSDAALPDSANRYGYGNFGLYSPIYAFGNPHNQTTNRLTGGMAGNWRPVPWFIGHATVGVDHGSERDEGVVLPQIAPLYVYAPAQLQIENATTDIYTVDLRGTARAGLTQALQSATSIGLQLADMRVQGTGATAAGITATNMTLNGAVNPAVTQLGDRQATVGGYAEEELGLADRLFITGAVRVDAGSGFGSAYHSAVYPKTSVSWLALNAGPTTLRLRGAFGESGVQPPNGAALQLYAPGTDWYGGQFVSSAAIANAENPRLQPERSAEYEGGADLGLWGNRVSVELTGYSKTTHNALVSVGTGWELGSYPHDENVGEVRNTGVEGAVTATMARTSTVIWDVSLNASVNRNRLVSLAPGVLTQQDVGDKAVYRFTPGYPLYGYWGIAEHYSDANHDGIIEPSELAITNAIVYAGSSLPTREASIGTHLELWRKAISLSALADYRGGFRLMNTSAMYEAIGPQNDRASNVRTAPLWQQARDVAAETNARAGTYTPAVGFYEDATYVRFRELSLTYAFPGHTVRAFHVNSLSITGAVRNVALRTRYTGVDPEVSNNSLGSDTQLSPTSNTHIVNNDKREDASAVPLLRSWVLRLNVGL